MACRKKLDILIDDFKKLEENRKDYIRELTRKLADIHCGRGYRAVAFEKGHSAFQNTNCSEGVLV